MARRQRGTFRSSSQAATCLSVYHTRWRRHTVPLIAERQAGKLCIPIFTVFGLTRLGIKPKYTVPAKDALSTRPLIGLIEEVWILRIIPRFFRPFAVILRLLAKTFIPFDSAFSKPNMAALHLGIGQIS